MTRKFFRLFFHQVLITSNLLNSIDTTTCCDCTHHLSYGSSRDCYCVCTLVYYLFLFNHYHFFLPEGVVARVFITRFQHIAILNRRVNLRVFFELPAAQSELDVYYHHFPCSILVWGIVSIRIWVFGCVRVMILLFKFEFSLCMKAFQNHHGIF